MSEWLKEFLHEAPAHNFPIFTPYYELTQEQKDYLWHGPRDKACIDSFFAMLKDGEFRAKVEASKGFCMHHFRLLLEEAQDSLPNSLRDWFREKIPTLIQENLLRMKADLDRFVMKNDYRNAALPWENAMDAVCRGMQKLQGGHPADPVFRNSDFGIRK